MSTIRNILVPTDDHRCELHMNGDWKVPLEQGALETLAAELALAAYRVALRTCSSGTWLDLELDLWRALADTAKTWREGIASAPFDCGDA